MLEFVPLPEHGRRYSVASRVRLSDVTPQGLLRLDGVARTLQDAATDDWSDCGIVTEHVWVARRTLFRRVGDYWPRYEDDMVATTWCSGTGAAWAERRTNVEVNGALVFEGASLWVPIDHKGFPQRIPAQFHEIFGEALGGRTVSGRVASSTPPADATLSPYVVRYADLDINGHVNNAAVWQAFAHVIAVPTSYAEVVHRGPVEIDHEVTLASSGLEAWLLVDGDVRVSARFEVL